MKGVGLIHSAIELHCRTLLPSLLHTLPSSTPMTPAPIIIIFSGTAFRLSAPVLLTTVSSSTLEKQKF